MIFWKLSSHSSLPSGNTVCIKQDTDYPRNAVVDMTLSMTKAETFTLALRIPHWSSTTRVQVNGKNLDTVRSGSYAKIARNWQTGDTVRIEMDFGLQFWRHPTKIHLAGGHGWEYASIYRGPVLLAYDARFNDGDFAPENVPSLAAPALKLLPEWSTVPSDNPLLLFEGKDANGKAVRYCDFASAGATGNYYQSWVPVGFPCPEVEFSKENPRRS